MKVQLIHDCVVRFPQGAVLEVSEAEGKRLMAFGNAKVAEEPKEEKPKKKKG